MINPQVQLTLLWFVFVFKIEGNAKFQFKVSETKDVIFPRLHEFCLWGVGAKVEVSWVPGSDRLSQRGATWIDC